MKEREGVYQVRGKGETEEVKWKAGGYQVRGNEKAEDEKEIYEYLGMGRCR